jgi:membrane protein involved in colicin uptake
MKKLRDVAANKKKRTKQTVGCTVINPEGWEAIQEGERALQHSKEAKANELARKREATAEKKAAADAKKVAKAAGKKNNKKGKKADHSAAIDEAEEAIVLLFQDIDYGDPNGVEAQLVAELEATTLNTDEAATTRSGRTRRAPVRFRNS